MVWTETSDEEFGDMMGLTAVTLFSDRVSEPVVSGFMTRDEALTRLRRHRTELNKLGVLRLYMFGSTARDEADQNSDVDLFFDYERGKLGLYELIDVKDHAAAILGCKADITTRDSLHQALRDNIEAHALRVF